MNYVEDIRSDLDARLPGLDPELIRLYTLLVLVKGMNTRLEDVHDAWAIWCNWTRPSHPSLVPFDELSAEVQSYDRPYRVVIVQLVREYIDEVAEDRRSLLGELDQVTRELAEAHRERDVARAAWQHARRHRDRYRVAWQSARRRAARWRDEAEDVEFSRHCA